MKATRRVTAVVGLGVALALGVSMGRAEAQEQAPKQRPKSTRSDYRGECRQTTDDAVVAQGACLITVKCDPVSIKDYGTAIPDLVADADGWSWICYLAVFDLPRFAPPGPGFIKIGDKLVLPKARSNATGSGSLTESDVSATLTMQQWPGVPGSKVVVQTFSGKFVKKVF